MNVRDGHLVAIGDDSIRVRPDHKGVPLDELSPIGNGEHANCHGRCR